MSTIISTGPGQGTRRTAVSRMPYWKPTEQEWIFLPVDKTHNQQVVEEDREGNSLGSINVYESKGWQPLRYVQGANPAAMAKLPTNWTDVARHGDQPVYADAPKANGGADRS